MRAPARTQFRRSLGPESGRDAPRLLLANTGALGSRTSSPALIRSSGLGVSRDANRFCDPGRDRGNHLAELGCRTVACVGQKLDACVAPPLEYERVVLRDVYVVGAVVGRRAGVWFLGL